MGREIGTYVERTNKMHTFFPLIQLQCLRHVLKNQESILRKACTCSFMTFLSCIHINSFGRWQDVLDEKSVHFVGSYYIGISQFAFQKSSSFRTSYRHTEEHRISIYTAVYTPYVKCCISCQQVYFSLCLKIPVRCC